MSPDTTRPCGLYQAGLVYVEFNNVSDFLVHDISLKLIPKGKIRFLSAPSYKMPSLEKDSREGVRFELMAEEPNAQVDFNLSFHDPWGKKYDLDIGTLIAMPAKEVTLPIIIPGEVMKSKENTYKIILPECVKCGADLHLGNELTSLGKHPFLPVTCSSCGKYQIFSFVEK